MEPLAAGPAAPDAQRRDHRVARTAGTLDYDPSRHTVLRLERHCAESTKLVPHDLEMKRLSRELSLYPGHAVRDGRTHPEQHEGSLARQPRPPAKGRRPCDALGGRRPQRADAHDERQEASEEGRHGARYPGAVRPVPRPVRKLAFEPGCN